MRNFDEIKKLILLFASDDVRIRAVLLNGSRANEKIVPDNYQDYDIVFVVSELESFTKDHNWTNVFGEKIIWQLPNEMTVAIEGQRDSFAYLMVFKDGNRIDLTLFPLEKMNESFPNDSLTKVWMDKDNLFDNLDETSDKDYWIKRPSEKEFQDICNEFWWVLPYLAKAIARDEIIYAKEVMELPLRNMFNRIVEIKIGCDTDFSVSIGKGARFIRKYVTPSEHKKILLTYSDHETQNIIKSTNLMIDLFRSFAKKIAKTLQFEYHLEEETNSIQYFNDLLNSNERAI